MQNKNIGLKVEYLYPIIYLTFMDIFNILLFMAKKDRIRFVCQSCGFESPKWMGKCTECNAWNSFVEEKVIPKFTERSLIVTDVSKPLSLQEISLDQQDRITTKSTEFDRVLGGGIVQGSVVLVGGDPGIGKSTLMLQKCAQIANSNYKILYISGEESAAQIKLRADRLGIQSENFLILAETNLDVIVNHIEQIQPNLLIVDSIQTTYRPILESAPGSVSQIRECAYQLINIAKSRNLPLFLIGHVTKEGYIAGPKVLEHMVDTLLYFEGDRDHFYRILRAVKNRFGSTNEIGVFEMNEKGLLEVSNPSEMFLAQRKDDITGSAVICVMEGTRSIMLEIQALVTPSNYGLPQRTATGVDAKRLAILLAVLEKRASIRTGTFDVFVNAVGGVKIEETSADLGIALAIASSLKNLLIDSKTVVIGELGLGGEIRAVSQIDKRISEAEKLGFQKVIIPEANVKGISNKSKIQIKAVQKLTEAIEYVM